MRKISFIMAALALVLGVTQCKKENKPLASGETQRIVLTASNGNDGSKVLVNEATTMLNLTWQDTDGIAASGAVEGTLDYKSGAESGIAKFEGSVTKKEGDKVTFSYGSKDVLDGVYTNQTGDVAWIQDHLYLESDAVDYKANGVYGEEEGQEVEMKLQYAVLKLDLSALGTEAGTTVTISNASGPVATVAGVKTTVKVYYVAMPAAASTKYTFSGNDKSVEKTWALENNIFYTKNNSGDAIVIKPDAPTPTPTKPEGALSGLFTINEDDDQVWFSQGNLWYGKTSEAAESATFNFENKQWDYKVLDIEGNIYYDPAHISYFMWSKDESIACSELYDYAGYQSTDVLFTNATETTAKTDFTVNGVNGKWRSLSKGEWEYLLDTRKIKTSTGTEDASSGIGNTYQYVNCNGNDGVIIYPDVYDGTRYTAFANISPEEFPESCVFLPFAGGRSPEETSITVTYMHCYWTSSNFGSYNAYRFAGNGSGSSWTDDRRCEYGYCVRLVSDAK